MLRFACFTWPKNAAQLNQSSCSSILILETENPQNPEPISSALMQTEFLRELSQIVRAENLSELEVESEGVRVTLKAPEVFVPSAPPATSMLPVASMPGVLPAPTALASPGAGAGTGSTPKAPDESLLEIVSPMVGVFYRAPAPTDPNFIEVGDVVEVGQTVALVEAMKVFNEIIAEVAGTVVEIKAQAAELVETGQVLITIRP
jgi:acetyl-CoA carboxylase biotin carboxyl carrier protein